jgi:uncharacterized membrane protein
MVDEQVGTPAGIVVAAVVLGLMAFVGLVVAACSAFALFLSHNPIIPRITSVRLTVAGLDVLLLALVILSVCTIVGLFHRKSWARHSMTLLGLLDFVTFGLAAAGILIGRAMSGMATLPIPNHPNLTLGDIMLGVAAFYVVLALVGVWWMIYFNVGSVRLVFAETKRV